MKGKKYLELWKYWENWDLNLQPSFLQRKKVRSLTTRPCGHYTTKMVKLVLLKYLSLPFTLFERYGAVFIMNSKNSSNEYFKTISHYFRVYSLSGFI